MYQYRDPNPEIRMSSPAYMRHNLQRSLGGYVRYSLSQFPVSALLNDSANPFPLASAISLNYYLNKTDERTDFYFQPYHTNVSCFNDTVRFPNNMITENDFPCANEDSTAPCDPEDLLPYFRESAWDRFTNQFKIDPGEKFHQNYSDCIDRSYRCR